MFICLTKSKNINIKQIDKAYSNQFPNLGLITDMVL